MNWIQLDSEETINEVKAKSREGRVFIFLFSGKVVTGIIVRNLLEREWTDGEMNMDTYFLDVNEKPDAAAAASKEFGVEVHSHQGLIIEKGKCLFSAIEGKVRFDVLREYSNPKRKKKV